MRYLRCLKTSGIVRWGELYWTAFGKLELGYLAEKLSWIRLSDWIVDNVTSWVRWLGAWSSASLSQFAPQFRYLRDSKLDLPYEAFLFASIFFNLWWSHYENHHKFINIDIEYGARKRKDAHSEASWERCKMKYETIMMWVLLNTLSGYFKSQMTCPWIAIRQDQERQKALIVVVQNGREMCEKRFVFLWNFVFPINLLLMKCCRIWDF